MLLKYNYQGTSFNLIRYAIVLDIRLTEGVKMRRIIMMFRSGIKYNPGKKIAGIKAKIRAPIAKSN